MESWKNKLRDSDALRILLSRERIIFFAYDPDGTILASRGKGLEAIGLKPGQLEGINIFHIEHEGVESIGHVKRAMNGEHFVSTGLYGGRMLEVEYWPERGADGKIEVIYGVCIDVSEREQAEKERAMLLEASRVLYQSLDYEATLDHLTRLLLSTICDYCFIDLLDEKGELKQVSLGHVDSKKEDLLFELQSRYRADGKRKHPVFEVVRTGKSFFMPKVDQKLIESVASDEREAVLYGKLDPLSAMVVPVKLRDRVLGTLSLVRTNPGKVYTERDLAFGEEIARMAAVAVDHALLYRQARERE